MPFLPKLLSKLSQPRPECLWDHDCNSHSAFARIIALGASRNSTIRANAQTQGLMER